jgi:hypothetical protein
LIIDKVEKEGISIILLKTPQAVEKFNQLVEKNKPLHQSYRYEGKKVNALIHTTC